ncbi:MAG TPA: rhomboid family intramembrane serine protease [Bacillota bacterium]|nr:rhomboid family intramembrane serine protease [Bacillota bacterium]HOB28129.1 rhomboid family intramembrane serine protease [Bacillota bacterium]HPZ40736.1 rhomboid family intramembrane serine protease [Bacillota bacterium]HQD52883.1 rhomboid family intramembrane serine protease [Bacillota bacterium]
MIPIRDTAPRYRFPIINIGLIFLNVYIFIQQLTLPPEQLYCFIYTYGTVPANLTGSLLSILDPGFSFSTFLAAAVPLVTANFLHGGWLHLIGNMLYLWIFGDNIEGTLGHLKYLLLYLFMGVASQLFHIFSDPFSTTPLVGASGAIAGVLGAYFILFPYARILTLVPIGFFITFVQMPAVIFLGFWFILQLLNTWMQGAAIGVQAVAWWAHIGGFIVGLAIGVLAKKRLVTKYRY